MNHPWCWIYRNYIFLAIILILVYIAGAFLAPVSHFYRLQIPSDVLYSFYGTACHQLAYRSWFLFGNQNYYPLEKAGIQNYDTYEDITGNTSQDLDAARQYKGNIESGYKVALCQRDVAIFSGLALSAMGFEICKRKWNPMPIFLWIVIGVMPIFIDGISQLENSAFPILKIFPPRESYPTMRTLTGLLFGVTTGLYLFPKTESLMKIIQSNHRCEDR